MKSPEEIFDTATVIANKIGYGAASFDDICKVAKVVVDYEVRKESAQTEKDGFTLAFKQIFETLGKGS